MTIPRDTAVSPVTNNSITSNFLAPPTLDAAGPIPEAGLSPQRRSRNSRFWFDDTELALLKYKRSDYEPFLRAGLRDSRILVDIDKLCERVLRIPFPETRSGRFCTTDARLNKLVDAIYGDVQFKAYLQIFLAKCHQFGSVEQALYAPHADMSNRAMEMIEAEYPGCNLIRFHRNASEVFGSSILIDDNLSLERSQETNLTKETLKGAFTRAAYSSINWAKVLLLVEGKESDCTLWDGRNGLRMLDPVTKVDPIHLSAPEPRPRLKLASKSCVAYLDNGTQSLGMAAPKRGWGGIDYPLKTPRSDIFLRAISEEEEADPVDLPLTFESEMIKTHMQCARYGFEALSVPALRDSFAMHLFDRNRAQVLYYSHTLMLASTAIDLEKEEDVKRFIALLVGHQRLKMREHGILPVLDQAESFLRSYKYFTDQARTGQKVVNRRSTYHGITMTLPIADAHSVKVILGSLIAQEPGIVGRSTCVFEGTCEEEWPGEKRTSEAVFLEAAKKAAEEQADPGKRHWVLDHLPNLLFTCDFATEADSTEARIAQMLSGAEFSGNKTFSYESRVLRVNIYELLYPLETLTSVQDVAQVFADVIQCHGWLYECPKILHRDISMTNIMYRIKPGGRICGVLNDFDLSSFLRHLGNGAMSIAHQRTGTPPFMAIDILVDENEEVPTHLYRHDLESFFYVMVVFMSRYELYQPDPPEKKAKCSSPPPPPAYIRPRERVGDTPLPFSAWFKATTDLAALREKKEGFFTNAKDLINQNLSPSFQAIAPWLVGIRSMFGVGFSGRTTRARDLEDWKMKELTAQHDDGDTFMNLFEDPSPQVDKRPEPLDNATLGGAISYKKFMGGAGRLSFRRDMVYKFFGDLP